MGMKNADQARREWGKSLSYLCATDESFSAMLPDEASGGSLIVAALESDSLHFVAKMLGRSGGSGTVVALGRSDEDGSARVGIARMAGRHGTTSGDCDLPVGPRCTIGDLFRILAPGASVTFKLAEDEFQILDAQERPAPAGAGGQLAGI